MFPSAMPYVNQVGSKVQIPTHNNWSSEAFSEYADEFHDKMDEASQAVEDIRAFIDEKKGLHHGRPFNG